MSRAWLRQRERGSPWLMRLMGWLTARLGGGFAHAMLPPITLYFFATARAARAASGSFLAAATGRPAGLGLRLRHFHAFAECVADRFLLLSGRLDDYALEVEGLAAVERALAGGKGCLLLGAHFGSFEVLRALAGRGCAVPVKILMYEDNVGGLHRVLRRANPRAQADIIPLGRPDATLRVKEALDAGAMVGILGDRIAAGEKVARVDFLGRPATFPLGPVLLAAALRVPVVMFFGTNLGARRYAVRFELLSELVTLRRPCREADAAALVGRYAAALEAQCRAHPLNWFNFYDFWGDGRAQAPSPAAPGRGLPARGTPAL